MKRTAGALGRFLAELARAQHRDQLILRAAALAYTTLLSLVPVLTVALALVARVQPERAEVIVAAIAAVFPFSSTQVTATLAAFAERTISLGWAAIVISALITINAFFQIEAVMNAIWGVAARRKLRWRLASFLAVLIWGPLLLVSLFSLLYWLQSHPTLRVLAPFTRPLPALFAFTVLAALYRWVPHARVPWRAVAAGAAVAAAALTLIHLGYQFYLDLATGLNVVYGSLAIVLFFLISLFLFWFAVLLGAEASWVVGRPQPIARALPGDAAVALLAAMAEDGAVDADRVASFLGSDADEVLTRLAAEPPLITLAAAGWRLARPADEFTVAEVRTRLGVGEAGDDPSGEHRSLAATAKAVSAAGVATATAKPVRTPAAKHASIHTPVVEVRRTATIALAGASMTPNLPAGTRVLVAIDLDRRAEPGDVVLFSGEPPVLHRVLHVVRLRRRTVLFHRGDAGGGIGITDNTGLLGLAIAVLSPQPGPVPAVADLPLPAQDSYCRARRLAILAAWALRLGLRRRFLPAAVQRLLARAMMTGNGDAATPQPPRVDEEAPQPPTPSAPHTR